MGNKGDKQSKHHSSQSNNAATAPVQYSFKVLAVGDQGAGKTSLIERLVNNSFKPGNPSSFPNDVVEKVVECEGATLKLNLHDTGGQESFRSMTSSYYRGSHLVMIVIDSNNADALTSVETWKLEIERYASTRALKVLVVAKTDLPLKASREGAQSWAEDLGIPYLECSSSSGDGIKPLLDRVSKLLLDAAKAGSLLLDDSAESS